MTTTVHTHAPARQTRDRCYTETVSVAPYTDECRAAHGGVTYDEICACGVARAVNVNGAHVEEGPWRAPERRFVGRRGSGRGYYLLVTPDGRLVGAETATEEGGQWHSWPIHSSYVPDEALEHAGVTRG